MNNAKGRFGVIETLGVSIHTTLIPRMENTINILYFASIPMYLLYMLIIYKIGEIKLQACV